MKSFAAVNAQGFISYTVTPATDDLYKEGDPTTDGLVFVELLPEQADHAGLVEGFYYNFATKAFVEKPPCPSGFHYWHEGAWVFDIKLLASQEVERRNFLLKSTDWTQLSDVTVADAQGWIDYRQALRDVPSQPEFPTNISWPVPPYSPTPYNPMFDGFQAQPGFAASSGSAPFAKSLMT